MHGELRTRRRARTAGAAERHENRRRLTGRIHAQAAHGCGLAYRGVEVCDVHLSQLRGGPAARRDAHRFTAVACPRRSRSHLVAIVTGDVGDTREPCSSQLRLPLLVKTSAWYTEPAAPSVARRLASPVMLINLYSDTQTRPVEAMRAVMAAAEVGDEQCGEDPTVIALCERVAALLGKPAAVFLPSGTMCNAIGFRLHIRPGGDAVHLHPSSHPIVAEGGGPSALSGAVLAPVSGKGGMFTADTLEAALFPTGDRYQPRSRLVSVEQTTNLAGGRVWPLQQVRAVLEVAARHRLRTHLDGARLMNAVVASGVPAAEWASGFDTAWIDFTKGLGAPVGAVLAGSAELVEEAWRYKQMMGGALRQAGIVAAGCRWALEHHVHRLAEDHANAQILAAGLAGLPGVTLDQDTVETNIVVFGLADAEKFCARLEAEHNVRMGALGPDLIRAVTHHDVTTAGVRHAVQAVAAVLRAAR